MKTTTNQEEGVYIIKRVKVLPKTGSCNYLYTIKKDNLTIFYRYLADQTIEKIELAPSLFGAVFIEAGNNVNLIGNGSEGDPYIISATGQNNKTVTLRALPYIESYNGRNYYTQELISLATDESEPFTVNEDEIYIINNKYPSITSDVFSIKVDFYLLKKGKGNYGKGQTTTLESDYFLIKTLTSSQVTISQALAPEVYIIESDDFTSPELAVNASNQGYTITDEGDVYFIINTPQTTRPEGSIVYRFVGVAGVYGLGGITTVASDFLLVEDLLDIDPIIISRTSQIINDGANGTDPFITANDIPEVDLTNFVEKTGQTTQSIEGDIVVENNVEANSFLAPIETVTDDITLTISDSEVIIDASSQVVTVTLPEVLSVPIGKKYTAVAYGGTNKIVLKTSGSDQIRIIKTDTTVLIELSLGDIYRVVNTGIYWQVISKS